MAKKQTPNDKAIEVFNQHIKGLNGVVDTKTGTIWKAALNDSITKYLGTDSSFLPVLRDMYFTVISYNSRRDSGDNWLGHGTGIVKMHNYRDDKKQDFIALINQIIEQIKSHGVIDSSEKTKTGNFLRGFTSGQLYAGITTIVTIVAFICRVCYNNGVTDERADKSIEYNELVVDKKESDRKLEEQNKFVGEAESIIKNLESNVEKEKLKKDSLQVELNALRRKLKVK